MLKIWKSTYFVHNGELLQTVNTLSAIQEHKVWTETKRGTWYLIIFITDWAKGLDSSLCMAQQIFEFLSLFPIALYLRVYIQGHSWLLDMTAGNDIICIVIKNFI